MLNSDLRYFSDKFYYKIEKIITFACGIGRMEIV